MHLKSIKLKNPGLSGLGLGLGWFEWVCESMGHLDVSVCSAEISETLPRRGKTLNQVCDLAMAFLDQNKMWFCRKLGFCCPDSAVPPQHCHGCPLAGGDPQDGTSSLAQRVLQRPGWLLPSPHCRSLFFLCTLSLWHIRTILH